VLFVPGGVSERKLIPPIEEAPFAVQSSIPHCPRRFFVTGQQLPVPLKSSIEIDTRHAALLFVMDNDED
jgi:hypothetical protein